MSERKDQEKPEVRVKEDHPRDDPGGSTSGTEQPAVQPTPPPRGGDDDLQ